MTQNLNHYEKILSRSHSNYLAQISIEMTDANNQINVVLSKLTAMGTVLVPMNLVTGKLLHISSTRGAQTISGLWGMNVHVPGQNIPVRSFQLAIDISLIVRQGFAWFLSIVACLIAFAIVGGYAAYRLLVPKKKK
jgi:magnesium transporter